MKYFMLRQFLIGLTIILALPVAQAQFDDVYDKAARVVSKKFISNEEADTRYQVSDNLSSRANQNRPSTGGYNPMSGGCNYNDPYGWNSYNYYSGAGFQYYPSYYSSWNNPYNSWNNPYSSWNNPYSSWNNTMCVYPTGNSWYYNPGNSYYSNNNNWYSNNNNWYNPFDNSNSYGMGGCDGYYNNPNYYNPNYNPNYNNGYNPYYPTGGWDENPTSTPSTYYGPRITGNTGSSPRGPATNQSITNPLATDVKTGSTPSISNPNSLSEPALDRTPGRNTASTDLSESATAKDETKGSSRRPVFKPREEKAPSTPGADRNTSIRNNPVTENASPRKITETTPTNEIPAYNPPSRSTVSDSDSDRPSYSPPPRTNNTERNDDKPSYTPRSGSSDSDRSSDKPSYSPSRNDSQGDSNSRSGSSYTPSRSSSSGSSHSSGSNSSSSGSSRSSGGSSGGSSGSPSSPRGRG